MAASGSRAESSIFRSMKRSGLTSLLLAATLFLFPAAASLAQAQTMMGDTPAAKAARRAEDLLKRYDRNGDGKLDDDERAEAKEAMMQTQLDQQMARATAVPGGIERFRTQALALFDRNKDGRLDDEERAEAQRLAEMRQDPGARLDDFAKSFDRNNDGKVDAEERTQLDAFLTELRALGANRMRTELLRQFDRNADAKIDDAEMQVLEKAVRPRVSDNPVQRRRYDRNDDGRIDDTEWQAARAAIALWLNATGPAALEVEPRATKQP
jgi:Ca2+-binding EF-hand superfamily protein